MQDIKSLYGTEATGSEANCGAGSTSASPKKRSRAKKDAGEDGEAEASPKKRKRTVKKEVIQNADMENPDAA
jgi:hypothetical protein